MNFNGISDLQQSLLGRRQSSSLRAQLTKLTQEIGSGKHSDVTANLSGNVAPLASVSRSLTMLDSYAKSAAQVDLKLNYASSALETVQSQITRFGAQILSNASAGMTGLDSILAGASGGFHTSVAALQARVGDQYVFSGQNSDAPPLIGADEMLAALRIETAGVTDPDMYFDIVDRWFTETGNGFDTAGYQGGAATTGGLAVSATTSADDSIPANASELRATLRDLAVISLVNDGSFVGTNEETVALSQRVGESLLETDDKMTQLRANLGASQQIVANAIVQNQSERFALSKAENKLTGVDLFEAAGRLEEVQTQLESLYLITARTSRLNLTEYLR